MKYFKYGLLALFFLLFALSWLVDRGKPFGAIPDVKLARYTPANIMSGKFQRSLEEYVPIHIPSRKLLLFFKNDLYELLNLGFFHSGAWGSVLQGKNGVLFDKGYLRNHYAQFEEADTSAKAQRLADILSRIKGLLAARNVRMLTLIAPAKTDFRRDVFPWLWEFRFGTTAKLNNAISFFEKDLIEEHIPHVNCIDVLQQHNRDDLLFPDWGIHWNMYAAALCLAAGVEEANTAGGHALPPFTVTSHVKTDIPASQDWDMAEILNLWPFYGRGRKFSHLPVYGKIEAPVPMTLFGDSFGVKIGDNLLRSGYSNRELLGWFTNQIPPKDSFMASIDRSSLLLIIFTEVNFYAEDTYRALETLIKYLEEPTPGMVEK